VTAIRLEKMKNDSRRSTSQLDSVKPVPVSVKKNRSGYNCITFIPVTTLSDFVDTNEYKKEVLLPL
jgi:hypothetical protein